MSDNCEVLGYYDESVELPENLGNVARDAFAGTVTKATRKYGRIPVFRTGSYRGEEITDHFGVIVVVPPFDSEEQRNEVVDDVAIEWGKFTDCHPNFVVQLQKFHPIED